MKNKVCQHAILYINVSRDGYNDSFKKFVLGIKNHLLIKSMVIIRILETNRNVTDILINNNEKVITKC
jgi:hypothetical protein